MILLKLFFSFLVIGSVSFGGGYAMIPLLQKEIVETQHWISLEEFTNLISISQTTPGPVAVNSATYIGFRIAGIPGSITATAGVILVPVLVVFILFWLTSRHKETAVVRGALKAIKPVLIALIVYSAYSIGKIAFTSWIPVVLAAAAFLVLIFTKLHPIYCILTAALIGFFFL